MLSSEVIARGLAVVCVFWEMGLSLKVERALKFWWREDVRNMDEEKNESEEGVVAEEAIVGT